MGIDCSITEIIKADFNKLWHCSHRGNTVEIVTPYILPDSTHLNLYFTERGDRIIATDGGRIWELIRETIGGAYADALDELRTLAQGSEISEGDDRGEPIFFKECRDVKLLSSIAFDVANFATMATSVILSAYANESDEKETKWVSDAKNFLSQIFPVSINRTLNFNAQVPGVPNVKFSAVASSHSRLWVVSCVNGSTFSDFRKNTVDASWNLGAVRRSGARAVIEKTIPLLNDDARGYDPEKLGDRLDDLEMNAHMRPILWSHRDELRSLLPAA